MVGRKEAFIMNSKMDVLQIIRSESRWSDHGCIELGAMENQSKKHEWRVLGEGRGGD
jgi:hypothetical protein